MEFKIASKLLKLNIFHCCFQFPVGCHKSPKINSLQSPKMNTLKSIKLIFLEQNKFTQKASLVCPLYLLFATVA